MCILLIFFEMHLFVHLKVDISTSFVIDLTQ